MNSRVKVIFIRDNYGIDYDVVEDFASLFCITKQKHPNEFQKFCDITAGESGLLLRDSAMNQVLFLERYMPDNAPLNMIYDDVVDYDNLLTWVGLTKADFKDKLIIVDDVEDPDQKKVFNKVISHYLDKSRPNAKPFFVIQFKRLCSMNAAPLLFPQEGPAQSIYKEYGVKKPTINFYLHWLGLASVFDRAFHSGGFKEFGGPLIMISNLNVLLLATVPLLAASSKTLT